MDSTDTQVGHVPHCADGQGHVEARHGGAVGVLERANSLVPPGCVVIFRLEALLPGVAETLDQEESLWRRLRSATQAGA